MSNYPIIESVAEFASSSSTTSHAVTLPSSIAIGDLLIMCLRPGNTITATQPTGWDRLSLANNNGISYVWFRIADGTESSTQTVSVSMATYVTAQTYRISNWQWVVYPEIQASTSSINPPSITDTLWGTKDCLFLAFGTNRRTDSTVTAAPTNYTNLTTTAQSSNTSTSMVRVSSARRNVTGNSDDPDAFTTSGTIDNPHAFTIAILGKQTVIGLAETDSLYRTFPSGLNYTSCKFPHEVSNVSNRILVVQIASGNGIGAAQAVTSVKWGTTDLTKVRSDIESGHNYGTEIWYLVNPTVEKNSINVAYPGTHNNLDSEYWVVSARTYSGIDQSNPIDANAGSIKETSNSTDPSTAITINTNGAILLDALAYGFNLSTATATSGQTVLADSYTNGDYRHAFGEESISTAGSTSASWDISLDSVYTHTLVALKPATSSSNVKKLSGITYANIKKVASIAIASVKKVAGVQ